MALVMSENNWVEPWRSIVWWDCCGSLFIYLCSLQGAYYLYALEIRWSAAWFFSGIDKSFSALKCYLWVKPFVLWLNYDFLQIYVKTMGGFAHQRLDRVGSGYEVLGSNAGWRYASFLYLPSTVLHLHSVISKLFSWHLRSAVKTASWSFCCEKGDAWNRWRGLKRKVC